MCSPSRSHFVRAALLVLAVFATQGAGPADAAVPQQQRAIFELVVNQVAKDQIAAVLIGEEVWVPVNSLEDAGVRKFAGQRQPLYGRTFVHLGSLAPRIVFELNERELMLHITVQPDHLPSTTISLATGPPVGMIYSRATSGFVNYAVNWSGPGKYGAFVDAGLSAGGALATSTFIRSTSGSFARGQTSLTIDDRHRLRRWIIGDSFANTGLLGGAIFLNGVSLSREYDVDPYFMRYPSADMAGAVMSPSTLEVYVNNRLVGREQLAPGRFDLRSLPLSSGRADTRLVVRDAFGREQELVSSFYLASGGLASGQQDYRYSLGYRRRNESTSSWDYALPAFLARHRFGLSDGITAGGRVEMSGNVVSGGPLVNVRLPIGELEVAAGYSRSGSRNGGAASVRYSYVSAPLNLAAGVRFVGEHYATLGTLNTLSSPRWDVGLSAAVPVGSRGSLTIRHELARRQDESGGSTTSMLGSLRLSGRTYFSLTGTNDWRDHVNGFQMSAGVGVVLGPRTGATVSHTLGNGGQYGSVDLQRSLPTGTGFGYRVSGDVANAYGSNGLQFQGPYGRYELTHDRVAGAQTTSIHASGGVVAIGGGIYATRPVHDGFALVQVPGVSRVRAYASNQEVGRTNKNGNLLVPGLLPYYGNSLSIADHDIPLDRTVEATQRIIAPPFRGGALVRFPVRQMQNSTGRVLLVRGRERVVPVYGQLTVTGGDRNYESPIGRRGEFYLENVPAGTYRASVLYQQRTCEFTVTLGPIKAGRTLDLGLLECRVTEPDSK